MQISDWQCALVTSARSRSQISRPPSQTETEHYYDRATEDCGNRWPFRYIGLHLEGEAFADFRAGKMSVQLPPYMSLDHDKDTRKASLSILDREERKQREMWGMSAPAMLVMSLIIVPNVTRYYPRISEQSYFRSIRRSYRYSTTGWGGLQSNNRALSSLRPARVPWTAIRFIEGRLLAPHRAWYPFRHESKHTTAYSNTIRGGRERGGESVRGEYQKVEGTGSVQGQGHLCKRRDYQAEGEEDQVIHHNHCVLNQKEFHS